jgi:hypothetical protein
MSGAVTFGAMSRLSLDALSGLQGLWEGYKLLKRTGKEHCSGQCHGTTSSYRGTSKPLVSVV